MSVLFRCRCGKSYRIREDQVGQSLRCSACDYVTRHVRQPADRSRAAAETPIPLALPVADTSWTSWMWGLGLAGVAGLVILFVALSRSRAPEMGQLDVKLGTVPASLEVRLDGKRVSVDELRSSQRLPAGAHHLLLTAPGFEVLSREFTLSPGNDLILELEMQALPADVRPELAEPVATLSLSEVEKANLTASAHAVLKKHCYQCHGLNGVEGGLHVLKPEELLDPDRSFVVAQDLENSRIWQRMDEGSMPPKPRTPPELAEREVLKRWILAGAPSFNVEAPRRYRSAKDELAAVQRHLRDTTDQNRKFQRYFSLVNLHNNSFESRLGRNNTNTDENDLRLARAALSKLLNSLSRKPGIAVPQPLTADGIVLQIDLRDYDWTEGQWQELVKVYPHGLKLNESQDPDLRDMAAEVYRHSGTDVPVVRVDWFVATASRPPLYEKLLKLPPTVRELETQLKVEADQNFLSDRLQRAGFTKSGVSANNRLVERHALNFGSYWKSFDFASSKGQADLTKHPLGPAFAKNPFPKEAFKADGGEMIFTLPNGLQGYYLADAAGKFLSTGPPEVVRDLQETAGTIHVVNGLSCIGCHQHGMISFRDNIRDGLGVAGKALIKVQALFPPASEMDELLRDDERRFLDALEKSIGPFLRIGNDVKTDLRQFREPVSATARLYYRNLEIDDVAAELGFVPVEQLSTSIKNNKRLRLDLGLGNLIQGASITRANWSDFGTEKSRFHEVSEELELGLAVSIVAKTAPAGDAARGAVAAVKVERDTSSQQTTQEDTRPTASPSQKDPPIDLPAAEKMPPRPPVRIPTSVPRPDPAPVVFVEAVLANNSKASLKLVVTEEHTGKNTDLELAGFGSKLMTFNQDGSYKAQVFLNVRPTVEIVGRPAQANFQYLGWFSISPKKWAGQTLDVNKLTKAFESNRGSSPDLPNNSR